MMLMRDKFIIICAFLILSSSILYAQEADHFPLNKGSIYEYQSNDIPDVCFFPVDQARWNGYKVTNLEWKKLTDYQKSSFVREGAMEIVIRSHVTLNLEDKIETWLDYVSLINQSLVMSEDPNDVNAEFEILPFYYNVLKMRGVVVDKDGNIIK